MSIPIPSWWQTYGCGGNACNAAYFITYAGPYYDLDNHVVDND